MAREYDPNKPNVVTMKVRKVTRGGSQFWTATCKEHNHTATGATENEAVLDFNKHLSKHPGSIVEKK